MFVFIEPCSEFCALGSQGDLSSVQTPASSSLHVRLHRILRPTPGLLCATHIQHPAGTGFISCYAVFCLNLLKDDPYNSNQFTTTCFLFIWLHKMSLG